MSMSEVGFSTLSISLHISVKNAATPKGQKRTPREGGRIARGAERWGKRAIRVEMHVARD